MSHHKCTFRKINNFNPTRGNSFKNRAQSTVHFQIKGTERRNIPWLINSWRDIGWGRGGGRRKVRSREVQIMKVESSVLKKTECEREEGEGDTREGL
jgi:hypothetical protein